jgi:hypothetical protein
LICKQRIATRFEQRFGLKKAVGIVDGTPVVLSQKPAVDGEVFFNRKGSYAMNIQLVVDDKKRIRFYQIGWPGSVADTTVFDKSNLVKHHDKFFSEDEYILADAGYALKPYVIVPFKQPAASLPHNRIFNELFSSCRCLIEHANGIWKNRWASLKGVRTQIRSKADFKVINTHILICIILHNILISFNDEWGEVEVDDVHVAPNRVYIQRSFKKPALERRVEVQNELLAWRLL